MIKKEKKIHESWVTRIHIEEFDKFELNTIYYDWRVTYSLHNKFQRFIILYYAHKGKNIFITIELQLYN